MTHILFVTWYRLFCLSTLCTLQSIRMTLSPFLLISWLSFVIWFMNNYLMGSSSIYLSNYLAPPAILFWQELKRVLSCKPHPKRVIYFIASAGTVYDMGPLDNPWWPSGLSDWGPKQERRRQSFLHRLLLLLLFVQCVEQISSCCSHGGIRAANCGSTSTYLMDLVMMPQSSGLTDPITSLPSFPGRNCSERSAPKKREKRGKKTPCASPRV